MTWLAPLPDDATVPRDLPPVDAPATVLASEAVAIDDDGSPLVRVPPDLVTYRVYPHLPLAEVPDEALLRGAVVDRLRRADAALPAGWSLCVLDAWRPLGLQRALVAHYARALGGPLGGFVADPDGPVPPPHTTGGTVDLTLAWRGLPVALGTDFDAFTVDAAPAALERADADPRVRDARRLLTQVMYDAGFVVNALEWWHWEHGTHAWGRATGTATVPFGTVRAAGAR